MNVKPDIKALLLLCLLTFVASVSRAQNGGSADSESCTITIFRDDGPTMYPNSYAITINGVLYRNVEDNSFVQTRLNGCPDTVVVKINREEYRVTMEGKSKYFRMHRPDRPANPAYPVSDGRSVGIMIPVRFGSGGKARKARLEEVSVDESRRAQLGAMKQKMPAR
jgi:hypothetical protein